MKSQTFKTLSFVGLATSMFFVTSCNKTNLSPEKLAQSSSNSTALAIGTPTTPWVYSPPIYGVMSAGVGAHKLYTIDRNTGGILTQSPINFTGAGGITHGAILGIAKTPGLQTGYLTVVSACVTGASQFYSFDFNTKTASPLGSGLPGTGYIKDIECHPISKAVYGIKDNYLVKMTGFGTMCNGSPTGTVPVTYDVLGDLSSVGAGPYSISFTQNGDCAIMSAKDHWRAYVLISGAPTTAPIGIVTGSRVQGLSPDLYSVNETASCISGVTQYIGISGATSPSSGSSYDFYKCAPSGSTYFYQLLDDAIIYGMADYTSETGTGIKAK
ncbi:MAG: hypothetical protein IPH32_12630 [Bacteroidetes bacterium]|nr:hypothetical protein [Bacteroidota bacterium]